MRVRHLIGLCMLASVAWANTTTQQIVVTNDQFTVTLPETPSTGYTWYLSSFDHTLIHPINKTYQGGDKPGAAGTSIWTFSHPPFTVPIRTTLVFSLERGFGDEAASTTHAYLVLFPQSP